MGICSQKYLTKLLLFLGLAALVTVISLGVIFNIILNKSKDAITDVLSGYCRQKISIARIYYIPPYYIIVKDFSLAEESSSVNNKNCIVIPQVKIKFSLLRFIKKKNFSVSGVYFRRPKIDYLKFFKFLRKNSVQIMLYFNSLPKENIEFSIKGLTCDVPLKVSPFTPLPVKPRTLARGAGFTYITADFNLRIKDDMVSASGSGCGVGIANDKNKLLTFNFRGRLGKDSISIENLEFKRENLYSKLWGNLTGSFLNMNGFLYTDIYPAPRKAPFFRTGSGVYHQAKESGSFPIDTISRYLLREDIDYPKDIGLSQDDFNIFDLDCRVNFLSSGIKIEHLSFSLNRVPYSIRGTLDFSNPALVDLLVSSYCTNPQDSILDNPYRTDLGIKGNFRDRAFNGTVSLEFVKNKKGVSSLDTMSIDLKKLIFVFEGNPLLKMYFDEGNVLYLSRNNRYKIFLKNFDTSFHIQKRILKFDEFHSLFYDGSLAGEGEIDMTQAPFKSSFSFGIRQISADKLDNLLADFSKVHGALDGRIRYKNYPYVDFQGTITIHNGYLDDFDFFKWLAGSFELPSLRRIAFNRLSTNFSLNDTKSSLSEIDLNSKDTKLHGYFTLHENNFVSSKLYLALSKKLLRESPKFTPLLKLLGDTFTSLSFDFQLSGNFEAMNFQWLESDFKSKLKERIPHFIERRIERDVENIIEAISQNK